MDCVPVGQDALSDIMSVLHIPERSGYARVYGARCNGFVLNWFKERV